MKIEYTFLVVLVLPFALRSASRVKQGAFFFNFSYIGVVINVFGSEEMGKGRGKPKPPSPKPTPY